MSTKYTFSESDLLHFVTFSVVDWIDVFTRIIYKDILIDSLKYCQKNIGLEVYGWSRLRRDDKSSAHDN